MKIIIKEVSPEDFAAFKSGSNVPDKTARLVLAPVPFPRAFFFAYAADSETPLARLGVSQSLEKGHTGGMGFLSGENYALIVLIKHGEAWLKAKGVKRAVGPIAYSTWFPYRVRLFDDEKKSPQFSWEPHQPRGEEDVWPASGFTLLENFSSRAMSGLKAFAAGHDKGFQKALSENFAFSCFQDELKSEELRRKLIDDLFDLTMESFSEASFFESISREQFHSLYVAGLSEVGDLSCSFIMRDAEGKAAAFNFAFIDQGYLVFKTLAVSKRLRGRGLSNGVLKLSSEAALVKNVENMIHALMRQGNKSENFGQNSTVLWEHHYGLFAKSL